MTHLTEEDLILAYYNEPGAAEQARPHLAECEECRAAAESLARSLSLCNQWGAPERPAGFGRDVWLRLLPALETQPKPAAWRALFSRRTMRVWTAVAGFAVLLMAVFLAGRYSRPAAAPEMAGLSDQARARILAIAAADHLDRVQILMTEIANSNGTNPATLAEDRDRAAELVKESRLVRQSLAERGESVTTNFLDETERFLIEAAHTPDNDAGEERSLRDRIESGSLLFKVRVVETNLRNEEKTL